MYGWEIAEQFKKLFLVGIMVWVANDTIVQLGVAMVFTMIFMLFSSIAEPYRKQDNATPNPDATPNPNASPNPNPSALTLTLSLSLTRALPQAGERLLRSHVQLLAHGRLPLLHHAQGLRSTQALALALALTLALALALTLTLALALTLTLALALTLTLALALALALALTLSSAPCSRSRPSQRPSEP